MIAGAYEQTDYSDAAIQTCLTMKVLFGMALMADDHNAFTSKVAAVLDRAVDPRAAAMILLSGRAGASSDGGAGACPPLMEYTLAEQARVAEEIATLPEGAVIAEWLG